jgi:small-conductance mechanosensitive channel
MSNFDPFILGKLTKALFILLGTLIVNQLSRRGSKQLFKKIPSKRAKTLISVVQNTASIIIFVVAVLTLLSELGINIAPLLTSAGIIGFAISFGSQSLIKDLIAGLFLLIEDTIREGEILQVAGIKGTVKRIGIRTTTLKDEKGTLHIIPNGSIKVVSNLSRKS